MGHLVHFRNNVQHNVGRINFTQEKIDKEFQVLKGSLKVDNPIISLVDKYKMWATTFS